MMNERLRAGSHFLGKRLEFRSLQLCRGSRERFEGRFLPVARANASKC
jgi:hypothetical protein